MGDLRLKKVIRPMKAFMDEVTVLMEEARGATQLLARLKSLLWYHMAFKSKKV